MADWPTSLSHVVMNYLPSKNQPGQACLTLDNPLAPNPHPHLHHLPPPQRSWAEKDRCNLSDALLTYNSSAFVRVTRRSAADCHKTAHTTAATAYVLQLAQS